MLSQKTVRTLVSIAFPDRAGIFILELECQADVHATSS